MSLQTPHLVHEVDAPPVEREAVKEYARRLAFHRARLAADLDGARLRLAWRAFERGARRALGAADTRTLSTIGVLAAHVPDDAGLMERRCEQLAAVDRLIAYTASQLDRHSTPIRTERRA